MRPFLFGNSILRQGRCIELGLNVQDIAIFDYIYQLTISTNITYIRTKEMIDEENYKDIFYVYLTYKKIEEDMPIVGWKERSLRHCLTKLENIGLIKRYKFNHKVVNSKGHIIMPNARMLYVAVNPEPLLETPFSFIPGKDLSLKNYIINRDINRSYEPSIKFKDQEYIYFNPGMQLDVFKLDDNFEENLYSLMRRNLKAQLTNKSYSYFELFTIKIFDNSSLILKFYKDKTIKTIIEKEAFKIEQAIVDAYKQLYTQKIVLENK